MTGSALQSHRRRSSMMVGLAIVVMTSGLIESQDAGVDGIPIGPASDTGGLPGGPLDVGALPVPTPAAAPATDSREDPAEKKLIELQRLAISSFRRHRIPEAIRYINDLITMKPYQAEFHFALALCYRFEKKFAEALKKYQDVLDLGGPKALIAIFRSEANAAAGDRERTYEQLKEAAIGGRNIIADVNNLEPLKQYRADTEFVRLALQLERVEIQPVRNDPFLNRFARVIEQSPEGGPGGAVAAVGPEVLTPEEQARLLSEAEKLADRIELYVKLQDEEKAMDAYLGLKTILAKRAQITVPKILKQMEGIQTQLPVIETQISGIRLRYYYNLAHERLESMREVFEDGEYARVESIHNEVENIARQMIAANQQFKDVATQIRDRSQKWVERARVRLDFEKLKPEIQGIIISGREKMTILDERIVKQGESLDEFRVVRIESNRVTFRYKGEEIPLVFRRF